MTPRDRRAMRLGLAAVLAAVVFVRVVPAAWRAWQRGQEELENERELLARAEGALAGLDSLEHRAASTRAALVGLAPRLLVGGSEPEAFADLNGRLALAAGHQRTRILRVDQERDSTREGRLRRVSALVQVESDWAGLTGFLRATLADPAVLRIRTVTVRGTEIPVPASRAEVLGAEFEVSGWYLTNAVSAPRTGEGE